MIYRVVANTKLMVGGWPQFFDSVFYVSAKEKEEAEEKAANAMLNSSATFSKVRVEYIGREYEAIANEEVIIAGVRYRRDAIIKFHIYEDAMQVVIYNKRNGHTDCDTIAVWSSPKSFKESLDKFLQKITYREV